MPQTTYSNYHAAAIAGQVVSRVDGGQRGRYECSEDLNFGRLVELDTGKLRAPQGTTLGTIIGGVPYNPSLPPGGFKSGEMMVPAFRKGTMWIEYAGTAPTVEAKPNIMHSSTTATDRGKVTASATSATAGSEISAGPEGLVVIKVDTVLSLALCEFNLPA